MRTWIVWLWSGLNEIEWNQIESTNSIRSNPKYVWCIVCCELCAVWEWKWGKECTSHCSTHTTFQLKVSDRNANNSGKYYRDAIANNGSRDERITTKIMWKWLSASTQRYKRIYEKFKLSFFNICRTSIEEKTSKEREREKKCSTLNSKRFSLFAINKIYWLH